MSGSSAGSFVAETPTASDEDRALDEAGRLAAPSQKRALEELIGDVQLLALRERAARHEARAKNNDAIRQRVTAGVYEGRVNILEDEIDKANRKIARLKSNLNRVNHALTASRVRIQELAAKAKKGGAS